MVDAGSSYMSSNYLWLALPAIVMMAGSALTFFWTPSPSTIGLVQHVAAGIILAAVTIEVFPEMRAGGVSPYALIASFAAGVMLMFVVKRLSEHLEAKGARSGVGLTWNYGFLLAVFLDAALDGLTIGAGFAAGQKVGFALAVGLSVEMLFLSMSLISETIRGARVIWLSGALSALLLTTAIVGFRVLSAMPPGVISFALAVAAAALLFLVTEELLIAAHELPERSYSMLVLFAGFIGFWLISLS